MPELEGCSALTLLLLDDGLPLFARALAAAWRKETEDWGEARRGLEGLPGTWSLAEAAGMAAGGCGPTDMVAL